MKSERHNDTTENTSTSPPVPMQYPENTRAAMRAFVAAMFVTSGGCSSSSSGAAPLDLQAIEFSLGNIVQRRIHSDMWAETVKAAPENPSRDLHDTPPPSEPCIEVESVTGDLQNGFEWKLRASQCQDLTGVTRVITGVVTFTGNAFADEKYTGTYAGSFVVRWSADPDGGRAAEAARLNAEAASVTVMGSWDINTSLAGSVEGTISYSAGSVTHEDEIRQ